MRPIATALLVNGLATPLLATSAVSDPNWTESVFSVNRNTPGDASGRLHTGLA